MSTIGQTLKDARQAFADAVAKQTTAEALERKDLHNIFQAYTQAARDAFQAVSGAIQNGKPAIVTLDDGQGGTRDVTVGTVGMVTNHVSVNYSEEVGSPIVPNSLGLMDIISVRPS